MERTRKKKPGQPSRQKTEEERSKEYAQQQSADTRAQEIRNGARKELDSADEILEKADNLLAEVGKAALAGSGPMPE